MTWSETEIILAALLFLAVAVAVWLWLQNRRTAAVKDRFGPEYDRTVQDLGDEHKAAAVLEARKKRVASYKVKPLSFDQRERFQSTWRHVQAQFVDDPKYAVTKADDLLGEVMMARGYPMADFDRRAEDLSVDHPSVVQNYRAGHEIAVRHSRGEATTEDLRAAMIHYRELFEDLVSEPQPELDGNIHRKEITHG